MAIVRDGPHKGKAGTVTAKLPGGKLRIRTPGGHITALERHTIPRPPSGRVAPRADPFSRFLGFKS